jgi:hypothetical protein
LSGNLVLTRSDGIPMNVVLTPSSGSQVIGSTIPILIPPGGTLFITANPVNANESSVGWARVESSGGTLGGVATFQYLPGGQLQSIAGVLSADATGVATIPVDDDIEQECLTCTGYAVANPGSTEISIRVLEVSADGNNLTSLDSIHLSPGAHSSRFLFQDPKAAQKFRGSAVLIAEGGASFAVVALVQVQGATGPLYTAIPVIPAKAPNIN